MAKKLTTTLNKFLLLFAKNCLSLWHRKARLFVELFLPAILCVLLVLIRLSTIPIEMDKKIYSKSFPLDVNHLDFKQWNGRHGPHYAPNAKIDHLMYTPATPCYESIIKGAANTLRLRYSDGKDVHKFSSHSYVWIVFDKSTDCHKHLNYIIRFKSLAELQDFTEPNMTWMTNQLFMGFEQIGPRNPDKEDGGVPVGYMREGFLPIQHAIAKSFFNLFKQNFKRQALPKVMLQRFPYPKYKHDGVIIELANLLPLTIMLGYMHPMMFIVRQVATEREKRLKEVLAMSGLPNWLHWTAWFVRAFVMLGFSALLVATVLTTKLGKDYAEYAILNYSSFTAVYLFFLVYIAASITFCFMLATMFSKANIAVVVTAVLWFITFLPFMPYSILAGNYVNMTLFAKLLWLLLPNTALNFGINAIMGFEMQGVGLHGSNMFDPVNADDSLSMGLLLIAMLVSCCIYMLIILYLEQIYVGDFGVAKKWNFPFKKAFWSKKLPLPAPHEPRVTNFGSTERESPESFQSEPVGRPIGIQIINLKKSYGKQKVVKGLTMNMYEDQITVLSVHNDAGKMTTISMIIGIIPPTSGTVIINGYDIKTDLERARMSLGICPRNDILFDGITVKEHLMFYSRLRGLEGQALRMEVKKYLKKTGLEKQANVVSSKLSGGAKRLLCLGTALCGGTKVVLCDESSSGLDPGEKKMLWKFLKTERKGRTILFTTNFMYEAEVLGDRIAIMCDGELKCMGTPLFLKKKLGYGFKLTIIKTAQCNNTEQITTFLNQYIPCITPKADIGTVLSYYLPSKYVSQFPTMLQELEDQSSTLAVNGFDISMTSLEEVFTKVCTENSSNVALPTMSGIGRSDGVDFPTSNNIFLDNPQLLTGTELFVNKWQAMFWKKILLTWRNKVLFAIQNLLPICLIVLTFTMPLYDYLPPLKIDLNQYHETVTVLATSSGADTPGSMEYEIISNYKAIIRNESSNHKLEDIGNQNFVDYILELGETQQAKIDTKYIAAATIGRGTITAWLNNEPLHSAPLTLNLIHNAIAKTLIGEEASIIVINEPVKYNQPDRLYFDRYYHNDATSFALSYGFCMSIITALYALNVIKEKQSRAKQFQFMSGIDVFTYWVSHFIFDYTTFALTGLVTIITLICLQKEGYSSFEELGRIFAIILLFGCAALLMTYILAGFFTDPMAGVFFLAICNIIYGPFIYYIIQFMNRTTAYVTPEDGRKNITQTMALIEENFVYYPHFALTHALKNLIFNEEPRLYCPYVMKSLWCTSYEEICCHIVKSYLSWESPGILREIIALLITTGVCFLILILLEYIPIPRLWDYIRGVFIKRRKPQCDDDSVEQEKVRVAQLSKRDIVWQNQSLVIKRLTKYYGKRVVVNKISVGIKHYECFGLLGGTGAGKTTLLKMLTGDEHISSGDAFVRGLSLKRERNAVYQLIGYCPQFDGLFDYLTGRDHLYIYALIRGVPPNKISSISLQLATFIGFIKHYYKPVHQYSWENKRKLNIALALLGAPSVIYLDEPTTGMDLASRRNVWNIICKVRDAGSSIVLTSQSMEECEALCNRLALMANGRFKSIGSTHNIKSRLTKGLILKIKMRRKIEVIADSSESELGLHIESDSDNGSDIDVMAAGPQKVLSFIRSKFPCAVLKESNEEFLIFYIPFEKKWWLKIFDMDANKDCLNIEDYSISQLPYEDIF